MTDDTTTEEQGAGRGERIAKIIARAGICSRRDAERLIADGRVVLNGRVLDTPAITVGPADRIEVDGKPVAARERTRLFLFHKPRGLVTTNRDPEGRRTVFSALPKDAPRLLSVGRLDINTEGLLLLTNDGGLSRILELPSTGWLRRYRVRAHGTVDPRALEALRHGLSLDGMIYGPIEAALERVQGTNAWLEVGLREGKNREVKRVLEHLGLTVTRLIRISFGPFQLGDLAEGELREIRGRVLRDQLGDRLARLAGADFDAPLREPAPAARETPQRGRKPVVPKSPGPDSRTGSKTAPKRTDARTPRGAPTVIKPQRTTSSKAKAMDLDHSGSKRAGNRPAPGKPPARPTGRGAAAAKPAGKPRANRRRPV